MTCVQTRYRMFRWVSESMKPDIVLEEFLNDKAPLPDKLYPQEMSIIRAMETGNTSPSLSFSLPPSVPPYPSPCLPLSSSVSFSRFLCAFTCTNYQVYSQHSVYP